MIKMKRYDEDIMKMNFVRYNPESEGENEPRIIATLDLKSGITVGELKNLIRKKFKMSSKNIRVRETYFDDDYAVETFIDFNNEDLKSNHILDNPEMIICQFYSENEYTSGSYYRDGR